MTSTINATQFLQSTRGFSSDASKLSTEVSNAYTDVARNVNARTIGFYATGNQVSTGNRYLLNGSTSQSQRQLFSFTNTSNIAHGLQAGFQIMNAYGSFTDGTNQYGLIYASSTAISGQISFYLTSTNIVFASGGGAPSLTQGFLVIEYIFL